MATPLTASQPILKISSEDICKYLETSGSDIFKIIKPVPVDRQYGDYVKFSDKPDLVLDKAKSFIIRATDGLNSYALRTLAYTIEGFIKEEIIRSFRLANCVGVSLNMTEARDVGSYDPYLRGLVSFGLNNVDVNFHRSPRFYDAPSMHDADWYEELADQRKESIERLEADNRALLEKNIFLDGLYAELNESYKILNKEHSELWDGFDVLLKWEDSIDGLYDSILEKQSQYPKAKDYYLFEPKEQDLIKLVKDAERIQTG